MDQKIILSMDGKFCEGELAFTDGDFLYKTPRKRRIASVKVLWEETEINEIEPKYFRYMVEYTE